MSRFVVVGRDTGLHAPSLAVGPFTTREAADEFGGLLERTTHSIVVVLPLHTPDVEVAAEGVPDGSYGGARTVDTGSLDA